MRQIDENKIKNINTLIRTIHLQIMFYGLSILGYKSAFKFS